MPSDSLEQEAMDRVARMYSSFERRTQNRPPRREPPPEKPKPEPEPEKPKPPVKPPEKQGGLLDYLMKDKEQSLIMLMLVLLMKDGADMNLLLALIYLLI